MLIKYQFREYFNIKVSKEDMHSHYKLLFENLTEKEKRALKEAMKYLYFDYSPDFGNGLVEVFQSITGDLLPQDMVDDRQALDVAIRALDPKWSDWDGKFFSGDEDDDEEPDTYYHSKAKFMYIYNGQLIPNEEVVPPDEPLDEDEDDEVYDNDDLDEELEVEELYDEDDSLLED